MNETMVRKRGVGVHHRHRAGMSCVQRWTPHFAAALLAVAAGCCRLGLAARTVERRRQAETAPAGAAIEAPRARDAQPGRRALHRRPRRALRLPQKHGDAGRDRPPDADHKRFEIRLRAAAGGATLDSPTLGHFAARSDETCYYIDVLPGTTQTR